MSFTFLYFKLDFNKEKFRIKRKQIEKNLNLDSNLNESLTEFLN